MRAFAILLLSALMLGTAGGYAWWALTAPAAHAAVPAKGKSIALPSSPEERPVALDEEWAARADSDATETAAAAPTQGASATERSAHYSGCNEVRAAGKAPLHSGEPVYREDMDGDGDGLACEPHPLR